MSTPRPDSPSVSLRPRWAGALAWGLLVVGLLLAAGSCFDRGVMDLDDTRLTTARDSLGNPIPYCADLPQNDARVRRVPGAGECAETRAVLDANRRVDHPALLVIGGLMMLTGLAILTGIIWPRQKHWRGGG